MLPTLVYSTKQTTLQPTLMAVEFVDRQVQNKIDHPSTHVDGQRVLTYRYSTKQTTLQPTLMATESTS